MPKRSFIKDVMHIKKSTEGTSNEISFSVLDAKKGSAQEQNQNSPRTVSELGKVALFTVPGKQAGQASATSATGFGMSNTARKQATNAVNNTATLGAQTEVLQRKQRRRVSRLLNIAAVFVILGVLVFVGTRLLSATFERQQSNEYILNSAIGMLEQTDAAFAALDEAVEAPAAASELNYDDVLRSLSAAASLLDRAANNAEQVIKTQETDALVEVASEVKNSALARKNLSERGRAVLVQGSAAKQATNLVQRAWDTTLSADASARDAAELLGTNTASNLAKSSDLSSQAMNTFQDALVSLREAKQVFPQADLATFESYLELRIAAQQNALASNAAIQEQDRAVAEANSAAYNTLEEDAAALAATLPENPAQPIVDAYSEMGAASDEAYLQARGQVARADAAIRAYKGL